MAKVRRTPDAKDREATTRRALAGGVCPRELEVLRILADGRSRRQIAALLFISPLTVHTHLKSIYIKLNVHKGMEAVNAARRLGLLE